MEYSRLAPKAKKSNQVGFEFLHENFIFKFKINCLKIFRKDQLGIVVIKESQKIK